MSIQVFKPKFHVDECLEAIRECLEKGWTGMGFKTTMPKAVKMLQYLVTMLTITSADETFV